MAAHLWKERPDLSRVKAVQWGKEKEDEARREYEIKTGSIVICCGLIISKERPLFAASPDGLVENSNGRVLIEIKCPWSLRNKDLSATEIPATSFLDRELKLKRSYAYYYQIQLGMYCTGSKLTHFVV